ncbi:MAG: FG-GAP-like repeat-containing protein, partial [Planctomycetota bacterium]
MLYRIPLAAALLGLGAPASGQSFGFVHQMLPADGEPSTSLALGDVDGDGDLDALVGSASFSGVSGQVRLSLNDGTGILTDVTSTGLPSPTDNTTAVALGDLDGDGDL